MILCYVLLIFYCKYRGVILDSYFCQCLFGNFELSVIVYIFKFNIWFFNFSKDFLVVVKCVECNKEWKGDFKILDLVFMCLYMDWVDVVIDDVCFKVLYNGQFVDEIWGSFFVWINSSILKYCYFILIF